MKETDFRSKIWVSYQSLDYERFKNTITFPVCRSRGFVGYMGIVIKEHRFEKKDT